MTARAGLGLAALFVAAPALAQESASEIVVLAPRSGPGELVLSGARAGEGAGTQGDPVKGLQGLPGLGRGGSGGGDIVAWGSTPRESRIEIDGVQVPLLYHGSGVRSVVPAGLVESLALSPGAFAAEHGRALGGLVQLRTRPADTALPRLHVAGDLLDGSYVTSAPLLSGRAAVQGSLRYGFVDRWLPRFIDPGLRGLYRIPSYWDAQAEGLLRLDATSSVRLVLLSSNDSSSVELASPDPARRQRQEAREGFGRLYLAYRAIDADGSETELTPFVGWDTSQSSLSQSLQRSDLSLRGVCYGLRARHRATLSRHVTVSLGLDAEGRRSDVTRQGSLSVPRREGDPYPFGTPPGADTARDDFRTHLLGAAPWAELELRVGALRAVPALRFEPTLIETSRSRPPLGSLPDQGTSRIDPELEPRLSLEQRLSPRVRLVAAAGRYHQAPDPADLSARFGNPQLGPASATHVSFGEVAALGTRTRLELTVFAKWLRDLPVRASDPEPRVGRALVATGTGRAFGTQLFLRQAELGGYSGWLSATVSRSERRDADRSVRLSDYDAPLVAAATLQKRWGAWRVGARARFSSGLPRTPVTGAYYDLGSQAYQPRLGPTNSVRLDDFFQLDLRVDRRFFVGGASELELYLDAVNVTFQRNSEEWAYSSDFHQLGSVTGLPPLVIVGAAFER